MKILGTNEQAEVKKETWTQHACPTKTDTIASGQDENWTPLKPRSLAFVHRLG
jgi:hypothetical protein